MECYRKEASFYVNGTLREFRGDPEMTLLEYLRTNCLTGTKLACGEGGCGACTVQVTRRLRKGLQHLSVNACLALVCDMDGAHVTTIEALADGDSLHPIQEAMSEAHGSQCGFCTPGFVMSMYNLWRQRKPVSHQEFEDNFGGNLCRCTGYRPIVTAFEPFISDIEEPIKCCAKVSHKSKNQADIIEQKYAQIFDQLPDCLTLAPLCVDGVHVGKQCQYIAPRCIRDVCHWRNNGPHRLQVGNTERRIEKFFKQAHTYPLSLISLAHVPELLGITWKSDCVVIGASESLSNIEEAFAEYTGIGRNILKPYVEMLRWFAGRQIRNVACMASNIVTASPISDLNPMLLATGARMTAASASVGSDEVTYRTIDVSHFFTGYRRVALETNEIVVDITIPFAPRAHFQVYKQARRRDDDLAIANAAFYARMEDERCVEARFAFGGMAPFALRVTALEEFWKDAEWTLENLEQSWRILDDAFNLPPDVPGGMPEFRRVLAKSFLYKYFAYVDSKIRPLKTLIEPRDSTSALRHSTLDFSSKPKKSLQYYDRHDKLTELGKPNRHMAGHLHATGKAQYTNDTPVHKDELFLDFVTSTKPHANILNVDFSPAEAIDGFVDKITSADVEQNKLGAVVHDEELFATKVLACGQIIAAVAATSPAAARLCAKSVKVTYEELPFIVSIEQAIEKESFHELSFQHPGDVAATIHTEKSSELEGRTMEEFFEYAKTQKDKFVVAEGETFIGGQDHFAFETHASRAEMRDDDVFCTSSSQNPTENQHFIAEALGVPMHKVHVKVVRIGGGFGGKESRACLLSVYACVAAKKLKRACRFHLDRDVDFQVNGKRHSFVGRYRLAANRQTHRFLVADLQLYCNAGMSLDLSQPVLNRAMLHCENVCDIPNFRVRGYLCKTNIQSNTAFRGFGGPQGLYVAETMYDHMAKLLGTTREELIYPQFYIDHSLTFYNHGLGECPVRRMWNQVMVDGKIAERRQEIEQFNSQNRYRKRGIALVPTKYGISFAAVHLNQSNCLIHVHMDGTVFVSHGGCEMGQGLHTKIATVVAHELDIPISAVHISETNTDICANTSATAASSGSDLNGNAALDACRKINEALRPYRRPNEDRQLSLKLAAAAAYHDRVDISARGFYRTPLKGTDWKQQGKNEFTGDPFYYYAYGVAASEVEVDCLTGDYDVLRTDIVHDVGQSLNPIIDVGQIEGAFVQGLGLFTIEETVYMKKTGHLFTVGPGLYKIPAMANIPTDFRVSLLKNSTGPTTCGSKAVGEPPLFLACSVFFALKNAIDSARREAGLSGYFRLDSPMTVERIRLACVDNMNPSPPPNPTIESRTHWHARA